MQFLEYYNRISCYTGEINLVFEFKESRRGLRYYTNDAGVLTKYFDSPHIVRDRIALSQNRVWNRYKQHFGGSIIVGYKGLWFVCLPSVWSPSIDAIFLLDTLLDRERQLLSGAKSILDFGCGSGVLGIMLSKYARHLDYLYLLDNNNSAVISSVINTIGNAVDDKIHLSWLNTIPQQHVDISVVTPYYFPVTRERVSNPLNTIVDCGVQSANLVNKTAQVSSTTIFVYSSTTEESFLSSLKVDHVVLDELLVPFTLGDNVSSQVFLKAAIVKGMLIENENSPFRYWHKIFVAKTLNNNG